MVRIPAFAMDEVNAQARAETEHARIAPFAMPRLARLAYLGAGVWQPVGVGKNEADRRALRLLKEHLTPWQRKQLKKRGWFHVKGSRGTLYRVRASHTDSVVMLKHGGCSCQPRRTFWCAVLDIRAPLYDLMLACKLWLETDEARFLSIAYGPHTGGGLRFPVPPHLDVPACPWERSCLG